MAYRSPRTKVEEIAEEFKQVRNSSNRSMHYEIVKAVLYLNDIYGNDPEQIDMIIEFAKKASRYNLRG